MRQKLPNIWHSDANFNIGQRPVLLCHNSKNGFRLVLDESSLVDRTIYTNGNWESEQQNYIFHTANRIIGTSIENAIFLDIGAYWGLYSIAAAQSNKFRKVMAFEPEPQNRAQLYTQIFINGLAYKIEVIPIALNDTQQEVEFWRADKHPKGNRGGVGILPNKSKNSITLKSLPLDNLICFKNHILIMKIDVEGAESRVIRGATCTLSSNQCFLQVEALDQNADELHNELTSIGFKKVNQIHSDYYYTNIADLSKEL